MNRDLKLWFCPGQECGHLFLYVFPLKSWNKCFVVWDHFLFFFILWEKYLYNNRRTDLWYAQNHYAFSVPGMLKRCISVKRTEIDFLFYNNRPTFFYTSYNNTLMITYLITLLRFIGNHPSSGEVDTGIRNYKHLNINKNEISKIIILFVYLKQKCMC